MDQTGIRRTAAVADAEEPGSGPVSPDPVRWATGRSRDEWSAVLDAAGAGAEGWDHGAVVSHLERQHPDVTGWWRQSIAVGYVRARTEGAGDRAGAG